MTRPPRYMSERERALHALAGRYFPRVGDHAIFSEGFAGLMDAEFEDDADRTVEVLRVSAAGETIWTRFVGTAGRLRYGDNRKKRHRWLRDSNGTYFGTGVHAPVGELWFR